MKAVLTTARGFLRRSVMENSLLVLGVAVAVFMGAIVTGSIISYSQYIAKLLGDPQYAEISAQPAAFTTMRSNAATKMDEDMGNFRFIFQADTAAKAMAESPAVSLSYTSEQDNFRTGEANQGFFGGPDGGGPGGPVVVTATQGNGQAAAAGRGAATGQAANGQATSDQSANGQAANGQAASGARGQSRSGTAGSQNRSARQGSAAQGQSGSAQAGGPNPADMMAAFQAEQADLANQDTSNLDTPLMDRIAGRTVSPEFFSAWGLAASEGSLFSKSDVENSKTVMVVGSDLAKNLFKDGISMGKRLKIEGRVYTVIGVLAPNDLLDSNGVRKINDMAFMPPRSFTRTVGNTTVNMGRPIMSLTFFVKDRSKIDAAVKQLQAYFDRTFKQGQVKVTSRQSALNATRSGQNALFGAISVLALLCLVVATLNIFNVSSIKTIRRRRSLGILRAIGASRNKAMLVFLVEVALLALSGSIVGLAFALPASGAAIKALIPVGAGAIRVNWAAEIAAALLSMVLPLAAGLFPAWRLLAQAPADLVRPE